ncbi:hypothetical protein [Kitasatospora indigofera]|uniref:hypothetical protein n=1 Tax=Kitasatospora indigofera TaxID=67307 RepID=UPI0036C49B4E
MTENTSTSANRTDSPKSEPFLTARTVLILLAAVIIAIVVGGLSFLGGAPVAGAVLAGLIAFGTSAPVLHKLIG